MVGVMQRNPESGGAEAVALHDLAVAEIAFKTAVNSNATLSIARREQLRVEVIRCRTVYWAVRDAHEETGSRPRAG